MKEADYRAKITKAATRDLRGWLVINHEDKFTANIPDMEILFLDRASWFEVKLLRKGASLKKVVKLSQCVFGDMIARVCGGRSWVIIFNEQRNRTEVWKPADLAAHIWPGLVGPPPSGTPSAWLEAEGLTADVAITAIKKAYARS